MFRFSIAVILLMGGGAYANVELDLINVKSNSIDEFSIQNKNTTSTRDILRNLPSIYLGGTNNLNQKIFMRGMSDRAVNISIDGARQVGNNWHHSADLVVDTDILKAIEINTDNLNIISSSLAGSVKFNTLNALDLLEANEHLGAKIKTSFASNNKEWQKSLQTYGKSDNGLHLLAYINHKNHSFSKDALKHESGGKGNNLSYLLKGGYTKDEHNLNISYENVEYKGDYPLVPEWAGSVAYDYYQGANLISAGTRAFDLINQEMRRNTFVLDYNYDLDEYINLNFKTYYTNRVLELDNWKQKNLLKEDVLEYLKGGVKTYGLYLDNKSELKTFDISHLFTYGLEYFNTQSYVKNNYYKYNLSKDIAIYEKFTPASNDISQTLSVFLQDKMSLGDFDLILGTKFNNYKINTIANLNQDRIKHNFNSIDYAARLKYNFSKDFSIYAGYSKISKGIDPLEMIVLRENRAKLKTNEDLKFESGYGYEFGLDYIKEINDFTMGASAKYYNRFYKNLIREETKRIGEAGGYYTRLNGGKYNIYGVDLEAIFSYKQFKSRLGYSRARTYDEKDSLVRAGYALAYSDAGDKYTLNLEYLYQNFIFGYDLIYFSSILVDDYIKPAYAKHDFYVNYEVNKNLDLGFSINNIFNKLYFSHYKRSYKSAKSADWEAGRDFRFSISYRF